MMGSEDWLFQMKHKPPKQGQKPPQLTLELPGESQR